MRSVPYWKTAVASLATLGVWSMLARADYDIPIPTGNNLIHIFSFPFFGNRQCPAHILIGSNGTEKGTPDNPLQTVPSIATYTPIPNSFQSLTNLLAVTAFSPPAGAKIAEICVENAPVRYRDDGTPTASLGQPVAPISATQPFYFQYSGALSSLQFIQQFPGAAINVSYYQ